jgi:hypothetical protein
MATRAVCRSIEVLSDGRAAIAARLAPRISVWFYFGDPIPAVDRRSVPLHPTGQSLCVLIQSGAPRVCAAIRVAAVGRTADAERADATFE